MRTAAVDTPTCLTRAVPVRRMSGLGFGIVDAPLALYRRYRPETFAEVIGQAHVTEPLQQALRNNRVHHAYLFSGPRGCGKTTSARILARCLNCEKGPTPDPCGSCQSCRDLARGGPGSIDVIEIDAASHGGVDDARDLRERAFFAPVAARYKIYIVDEAHMVTTQGFNALLKLVEEPPEHLKFIFATTEPDKVIGTIRSRTHHYPFRLVPPKLLQEYLARLCEQEGVRVDPAVLPLVVRAGGGSVRDTLSVLDQLIGGAGEDGVTYSRAVALLGYTHDSLLDEVVDALAAHDAAGVFAVVEKVINSGQDPRRFAEDLLRRLRDLLIVSAVPDAVSRGLLDVPADQGERLAAQAARFGTAELTRAAEVVNAGLTEMRGATAPRLHLELICARVLLPASDDSTRGLSARLDRIERRLNAFGRAGEVPETFAASPVDSTEQVGPSEPGHVAAGSPSRATGGEGSAASAVAPAPGTAGPARSEEESGPQDAGWPDARVTSPPAQGERAAEPAPVTAAASAGAPAPDEPASAGPRYTLADVRRMWPHVLEEVKHARRFTWVMLSQNAQVTALHDDTLTVALVNAGARDSFVRSGSDEVLRKALQRVLHVDWRIEAVIDPSTGTTGGGGRPGGGGPGGSGRPDGTGGSSGRWPGGGRGSDTDPGAPPATDRRGPGRPGDASSAEVPNGHQGSPGDAWNGPGPNSGGRATSVGAARTSAETTGGPADWPSVGRPAGGTDGGASEDPGPGGSEPNGLETNGRGGGQARPARGVTSSTPAPASSSASFQHDPDSEVDPETDAALTDSPLSYSELLRRELGAELIEERVGE
ncbi:DNA polymerase-3 subunit gamma/tau [Thermasporomyces composti]|uniref:DNA polymerase III subunit gamma/tau n=2 Tax=Thermasporomyces composti TaxID=696763 RepID=A0A3D9V5I5_THECX|nr:DNA polymerase-3 subunit gamma/tau [Thermasporomyces composti]